MVPVDAQTLRETAPRFSGEIAERQDTIISAVDEVLEEHPDQAAEPGPPTPPRHARRRSGPPSGPVAARRLRVQNASCTPAVAWPTLALPSNASVKW